MKPAQNIISTIAAGIIGLGMVSAQAATRYTVQDLGEVSAFSLNNSGQVAGTISGINEEGFYSTRGFFTGANGQGKTYVGEIDSLYITDSGQLYGRDSNGSLTATTAQPNMAYVNFPEPFAIPTVSGINASGQMVGNSWNTPTGTGTSFITGPNGVGVRELPAAHELNVGSNDFSMPIAINASGQVLGRIDRWSPEQSGAYITGPNGQNAVRIGSVGDYASGNALNDRGDVVGNLMASDGTRHGFVVYANGVTRDLGMLAGNDTSVQSINNLGQMVGFALAEGFLSPVLATIVDTDTMSMVDLNTLLVDFDADTLNQAIAINDSGQILALGNLGHSYILNAVPVPEAPTNALMLLGLGALSIAVKRKAKPQQAR